MLSSSHIHASEHLDAFEAFLRVERRRGALTIRRYSAIIEEFLGSLGDAPVSAMTKHECIAFMRSGSGEAGPSRSVWNLRLAALRSFVCFLMDKEVLMHDPTLGIERHKIASREPIPLSLDEFLAMLEAAERTGSHRARNVAIVQALFHTALRVSEIVSLDVDHVDWDAYVFRDVRTKGEKWLSAPFNDMVAEAIDRYLVERARCRAVSPVALFLSKRGERLSVRAVQELIRRLGKAAGIARPVTPHLLRHSNATELVELGTPIKVVQEICGHASQATTERYVHARAGAHRAAIDALGVAVARRIRARRQTARKCA